MPFTFAVDPAELIEERAPQWRFGGTEDAAMEEMSRRISDLWAEGPGGLGARVVPFCRAGREGR